MKSLFYSFLTSLIFCTFLSPSIGKAQKAYDTNYHSAGPDEQSTTFVTPIIEGFDEADQQTQDVPSFNKTQEFAEITSSSSNQEELPTKPFQPQFSESSSPKPANPGIPDESKQNLDSPDILVLSGKLLHAIAQLQIPVALSLANRYMQISPEKSDNYLDKASIKNIITFLNDLSYANQMMMQGETRWAADRLKESRDKITFEEMETALEKMETKLKGEKKRVALDKKMNQAYMEATQNLNAKRWLDAIAIFTKISVIDPNFMQVKERLKEARIGYYFKEAARLVKEDQWVEARNMYRSIMEINPENIDAARELTLLTEENMRNRVALYHQQAREAIQADNGENGNRFYKKILKLDPQNTEAQKAIASNAPLSLTKKILNLFHPYREFLSQYGNSIKPVAAGVGGIVLLSLLILRFGKIRKYYQNIKKVNTNRLLYEDILENSPDRRALYPSLASIYRQLKMDSKLSGLQEMCNERLHNSNTDEAPLWQLCLGEISQEYGDLEVALREMEQAWHMAPTQEEIRQKLQRLYSILLERDPENTAWKIDLQNVSSFSTPPPPASPASSEMSNKISELTGNEEIISPPPIQQKETIFQSKKTEEENKKIINEVLGRANYSDAPEESSPYPHIIKETTRKPEIFNKETKKEAYTEIFGRRKKQSVVKK